MGHPLSRRYSPAGPLGVIIKQVMEAGLGGHQDGCVRWSGGGPRRPVTPVPQLHKPLCRFRGGKRVAAVLKDGTKLCPDWARTSAALLCEISEVVARLGMEPTSAVKRSSEGAPRLGRRTLPRVVMLNLRKHLRMHLPS